MLEADKSAQSGDVAVDERFDSQFDESGRPPAKASRGERGRGRGRGGGSRPSGSSSSAQSSTGPHQQSHAESVTEKPNLDDNTHMTTDYGQQKDVLWTVGWDQYFREVRHKTCIDFSTERMDRYAGNLVGTRKQNIKSKNQNIFK